jgi:hypothetical protein
MLSLREVIIPHNPEIVKALHHNQWRGLHQNWCIATQASIVDVRKSTGCTLTANRMDWLSGFFHFSILAITLLNLELSPLNLVSKASKYGPSNACFVPDVNLIGKRTISIKAPIQCSLIISLYSPLQKKVCFNKEYILWGRGRTRVGPVNWVSLCAPVCHLHFPNKVILRIYAGEWSMRPMIY